jgi:NCS1 family nucleobase:cation symporter-1
MGATEFKATVETKLTTLKNAFRSREGFKYFIETHDTALDRHGHPDSKQTWSNEDLDPTPPEKRTCTSKSISFDLPEMH